LLQPDLSYHAGLPSSFGDTEKYRSYLSEEFIRGLARTRGTQIETAYAEAFEVIRWVIGYK
jgi:hypothetical protein